MRGRIAEIGQDWRGAAFWFDRAIRDAPSLPFAETDWGTMLLRRHGYDGAIAHYEMAHVKSPHFADPLELWGEALIAQNRSDLAIPKFEEAARYAPNWGRLHFKWGEALLWLGREDDAQKQFALAASLDLVPADRATLARMRTSQ
jgi:tetratricopeptide (TPR) repeat protein